MAVIGSGHGVTPSRRKKPAAHGSYCYMFPDLAKKQAINFPPGPKAKQLFADLEQLALHMDEIASAPPAAVSDLQAIYTYFGQFMNHDLSAPVRVGTQDKTGAIEQNFDLNSLLSHMRAKSPATVLAAMFNEHASPLMLHSLYGSGPFGRAADIRKMYDPATAEFKLAQTVAPSRADLAVLAAEPSMVKLPKRRSPDLTRDPRKNIALIADQRNDENLVLSQLHLAFMLFHNNTVKAIRKQHSDPRELFEEARKLVTWHYHWCIINDYLKHLLPRGVTASRKLIRQQGEVPLEFTTAAFRFGHSMVSEGYDYNRFFTRRGPFASASLRQLFAFTSRQKMGGSSHPSRQVPDHWVIDWNRFLKIGSAADGIDASVATNMTMLTGMGGQSKKIIESGLSSICHRNLKRGYQRFMASGQDYAKALGVAALRPGDILGAVNHDASRSFLQAKGFDRQTPAWFYFLCEAKVHGSSNTLGPAAGAMIAETIMGLLQQDPGSVLHAKGGSWTPKASPLRVKGNQPIAGIAAFLRFAGVLD